MTPSESVPDLIQRCRAGEPAAHEPLFGRYRPYREVSLDQMQTGVDQSSLALGRCLAAHDPSPSQAAQQRERAVRLAEALSRLPDDYRTVLLLRVFEELPAEEVALRMDRSAGAVR